MKTTVWKFLMEHRIKRLPIDPIKLAKAIGYEVYNYHEGEAIIEALKLQELIQEREGISTRYEGKPCILYSPGLSHYRQNHVILHELGHCAEGHDNSEAVFGDSKDMKLQIQQEEEAEAYALEAIPTPVLYKAGLTTAKDIQRVTQLDGDAVDKILSTVSQYEYIAFGVEENEICNHFRDFIREHKRTTAKQLKYRQIAIAVAAAIVLMVSTAGITTIFNNLNKPTSPTAITTSIATTSEEVLLPPLTSAPATVLRLQHSLIRLLPPNSRLQPLNPTDKPSIGWTAAKCTTWTAIASISENIRTV